MIRSKISPALTATLTLAIVMPSIVTSSSAYGASDDVKVESEKLNFTVETIAQGLSIPWGMAALPDGGMLITERTGTLRLLDTNGKLHPNPIQGTPDVRSSGQGGLLDVALHPDYKNNGWIYLSYSSPKASGESGRGANTALMRAKLKNHQLIEQQLLFKALPNYSAGQHYGSRITFDSDNHVYMTIGDRGGRDETQSLNNYRGKIIRLHDDGSIPTDNPYLSTVDAKPEIWSWGHRNPQGMEQHPETGKIWAHEHGPKGGDELNLIVKGQNYGWPIATYGVNYSGTKITDIVSRPDMVSPVTYWVPSIAPCGMAFVQGNNYSGWKNNILVGSLKFQQIQRLEITDGKMTHKEVLLDGVGRVRALEQGADGYIYVAVETGGRIMRLIPE